MARGGENSIELHKLLARAFSFLGGVMQKDGDERVTRLQKKWCEDLWKEKHGLTSPWDFAKDGALLKNLIKYVELNARHEDAEQMTANVMIEFLKDKDEKLEKALHPFSWLFKARAKYMKALLPKKQQVIIRRYEAQKEYVELTDERIVEIIQRDPEKFTKGFTIMTSKAMKAINPNLYQRVKNLILELVGKERAIEIARKAQGDEKEKAEMLRGTRNTTPSSKGLAG